MLSGNAFRESLELYGYKEKKKDKFNAPYRPQGSGKLKLYNINLSVIKCRFGFHPFSLIILCREKSLNNLIL